MISRRSMAAVSNWPASCSSATASPRQKPISKSMPGPTSSSPNGCGPLCWLLRISVRKQGSKQQHEQLHCHLPKVKMEQERILFAPSAMHFLERISEVASTVDKELSCASKLIDSHLKPCAGYLGHLFAK